MKQLSSIIFISFFIFFFCANSIAQTIINYQTWTGASGCNIFGTATNVPATLNGTNTTVSHKSAVGQPAYDAANHAVSIDGNIQNLSIYLGTEYGITYNFKSGYTYSITVNASSINNQGSFPTLRLTLTNSPGSSVACTGPASINNSLSGTGIYTNGIVNSNFIDYSYNVGAIGANYSYLAVANIPALNGGYQTILIRKITITETAPAISFSLASPSTLTCGTTNGQTFTVNHTGNPQNVTYDWNLGPTPNGWTYNSNPAPQYITGQTSNILTLTPNFCPNVLPNNVSVTVKINGTTNTTLNSAFTINDPALTISGAGAACSSPSTFLIAGLPCRANVTWSYTPTGSASITISPSGQQVSVTGGSPGSVNLKATVTNMCVATSTVVPPKVLRVGVINGPTETPITVGYTPTCKNTDIDFRISAVPSATSYTWTKPSGWSGSILHNITYRAVTGNTAGTFPVSITVTNACGAGVPAVANVVVNNCGARVAGSSSDLQADDLSKSDSIAEPSFKQATIFPNPSSNIITVYIPAKKITENKTVINIFDMNGNTIRRIKPVSTSTDINISGFSGGSYTIQLFDGKKLVTKKIIKQ